MDSNYASVTEQAGIYAGAGGFHVETQGITSLTGAVIDSTVDSKEATSKNTLTTGDLVLKDIENKADYKVSSKGIAYNKFEKGTPNTYNEKGLIPVLMPGASDKDSSVTKAAIGAGTITVKNQPNFDVAKLNRDTQNSLNKLGEIFDKKKIEERQELAKLIAKDAFNQLHYWNPKTKEDKAAKAIVHGIVGEIAARVAGNAPGSGFTATMTNEALTESIAKVAKDSPDVAQWLSAIVGTTVNKVAGKDARVGAATAQYGMKWNKNQTIPEIKDRLELLKHAGQILHRGEWISLAELAHDENGVAYMFFKGQENGTVHYVAVDYNGDVFDVEAISGNPGKYFSLTSTKPLDESIAWYNTREITLTQYSDYSPRNTTASHLPTGHKDVIVVTKYDGNLADNDLYNLSLLERLPDRYAALDFSLGAVEGFDNIYSFGIAQNIAHYISANNRERTSRAYRNGRLFGDYVGIAAAGVELGGGAVGTVGGILATPESFGGGLVVSRAGVLNMAHGGTVLYNAPEKLSKDRYLAKQKHAESSGSPERKFNVQKQESPIWRGFEAYRTNRVDFLVPLKVRI